MARKGEYGYHEGRRKVGKDDLHGCRTPILTLIQNLRRVRLSSGFFFFAAAATFPDKMI